jgi:starvation-inducible DNA-binding protein
MKELIEQMKICHATNFAFFVKAQNFHWNVEGPSFPQYHKFFEKIYTLAFETTDILAEQIRQLDSYAPASFQRYTSLSKIEDELNIPSAMNMNKILQQDISRLIDELKKARRISAENYPGLNNILEDRISEFMRYNWQLKSVIKG